MTEVPYSEALPHPMFRTHAIGKVWGWETSSDGLDGAVLQQPRAEAWKTSDTAQQGSLSVGVGANHKGRPQDRPVKT